MRVAHDMASLFTVTSIHRLQKSTRNSEKFGNKSEERERNQLNKLWNLKNLKRKGVQKKKLIDTLYESNIKAVVEEHVSSENVHSANRLYDVKPEVSESL